MTIPLGTLLESPLSMSLFISISLSLSLCLPAVIAYQLSFLSDLCLLTQNPPIIPLTHGSSMMSHTHTHTHAHAHTHTHTHSVVYINLVRSFAGVELFPAVTLHLQVRNSSLLVSTGPFSLFWSPYLVFPLLLVSIGFFHRLVSKWYLLFSPLYCPSLLISPLSNGLICPGLYWFPQLSTGL